MFFSTGSKGTAMQKPGNNAQDFWVKPGCAQTWRADRVALGLCTLRKSFNTYIHTYIHTYTYIHTHTHTLTALGLSKG
jgi:hypothetical protein